MKSAIRKALTTGAAVLTGAMLLPLAVAAPAQAIGRVECRVGNVEIVTMHNGNLCFDGRGSTDVAIYDVAVIKTWGDDDVVVRYIDDLGGLGRSVSLGPGDLFGDPNWPNDRIHKVDRITIL